MPTDWSNKDGLTARWSRPPFGRRLSSMPLRGFLQIRNTPLIHSGGLTAVVFLHIISAYTDMMIYGAHYLVVCAIAGLLLPNSKGVLFTMN